MNSRFLILLVCAFAGNAFANGFFIGAKNFTKKDGDHCEYNITIPQVKPSDETDRKQVAIANKLNSAWSATANAMINEYEVSILSANACTEIFESIQIDYSFEITNVIGAKLVSLVFSTYRYLGGAHGLMTREKQIFNVETGEEYENLSSFLRYGAVDQIKSMVEDGLKKTNPYFDPSFGWNDVKESWKHLYQIENFYITKSSIVIFFDPYAVGSYAEGPLDAEIHFYDLDTLFREDAPSLLGWGI